MKHEIRTNRPEHSCPRLPVKGQLVARYVPIFATPRPGVWEYVIEDDDAGTVTSLTREEYLDLLNRLAVRHAEQDTTPT